jgi:hypothetical protein
MSIFFFLFGYWLSSKTQLEKGFELYFEPMSDESISLIGMVNRMALFGGLPFFAYQVEGSRMLAALLGVMAVVVIVSLVKKRQATRLPKE